MTQAISKSPVQSVALAAGYSRDQVDLLKRTIAKGASDDEFSLFMATCQHLRLDPFAGQICAVFRKDKDAGGKSMTIQITIDGHRLNAQRSGMYQGQTEPEWCGPDGKWVDVWLEDTPPAAARVGVYKLGARAPIWGIALFRSSAQKTPIWSKMPEHMLAKCAESNALRKAFPIDTMPRPTSSGIHRPVSELRASLEAAETTIELAELIPELEALPEGQEKHELRRVYTAAKRRLFVAERRTLEESTSEAIADLGEDVIDSTASEVTDEAVVE